MIKVGINGFGRIGRLAARIILQNHQDKIELGAVNTSGRMDTQGWVHLFKYDSAYGQFSKEVGVAGEYMVVGERKIPVMGERDPEKIPWPDYGVESVIESTGVFRTKKDAAKHLRGTVKRVVMSAPPKSEGIPMHVFGVNDEVEKGEIISCGSCTTNCAAPVVKVVDQKIGIEKSLMTTIHSYTSSQQLLDGSSKKDLRRARAAAVNLIPTTTGAAKATGEVYPRAKGIFDGMAVRVPTITGSLTDFVFQTSRKTSEEELKNIFRQAANKELKGVLAVTEEPLVTKDIVGNPHSCIVDLELTRVIGGDLVKIFAWYDNEWGYANRLVEELIR
jgi:glyceraldehyde 3-phosphate dehydrogenase